jgi:type II secretory pathway component PulF
MPVYAYRALTAAGRACEGVVDADSEQAAWQTLRTRGMYPTTLRADGDAPHLGAASPPPSWPP